MFVYEKDGVLCGYYNLLMQENNECELGSLSVLPEYRHKGIGKELLMHSLDQARKSGCKTLNLSIVEENQVLRRWYEANGAEHLYTKKFDFFAFTAGYMKIAL
jgi:N-acetylglutamate synthase-like GNAT family acetyltransferase